MKYNLVGLTVVVCALCACATGAEHMQNLHTAQDRALTVGMVQREIRNGMSAGDVAQVLGSPNIVSRDSSQRETWIYDKIATEASYSNSNGNVGGLVGTAAGAGAALILGGVAGSYDEHSGAAATTQRTLTVVIKFDADSRVQSANYHSSSF